MLTRRTALMGAAVAALMAMMVLPCDGLREPSPAGDGLAFPADQVPA